LGAVLAGAITAIVLTLGTDALLRTLGIPPPVDLYGMAAEAWLE
jgi:hypothetical protein